MKTDNIPKSGVIRGPDGKNRCFWCNGHDDYRMYHDTEWGRPVSDDTRLFEKICLEGFQSGLSWLTILRKRENFRKAFRGFDYKKIAKFTHKDIKKLLKNTGIVRHRGKIESVINNAKRAPELQKEFGSLGSFFWRFEPDEKELPRELNWEILQDIAKTEQSAALSKELKRRGWSYVGPTTMYAFMQGVGIVNDHVDGCAFREEVERERKRFRRPV